MVVKLRVNIKGIIFFMQAAILLHGNTVITSRHVEYSFNYICNYKAKYGSDTENSSAIIL